MKPSCRAPAAVVLAYSYEQRLVSLEDAPDDGLPPQTYALCAVCADAFSAPRGWELRDLRSRPRLYASLSGNVATPSRVPRRDGFVGAGAGGANPAGDG